MAKSDDDDDDVPVKKKELSGMDALYANTNIVILIFFSLCCNGICVLPLILSIIGVLTCTDEKAKSNAKLSLIISAVMVVIGVLGNIVYIMLGVGGAAGGARFK